MRNLKRVLSLALALVMVLGMMVIGTSAATFTDEESITYKEAVEVMSGLGILNGYQAADGTYSFNPTGTLERDEAAKIIAYVAMGADVDEYLAPTTPYFTDIADSWAAKYINVLVNLKVVDGNGDGTYNPDGKLTVAQFAKMLLLAAGVEGTFTGAEWKANVKEAFNEQAELVATGLKITEEDPYITREEACHMALAAMKVGTEKIEYYVLDDANNNQKPDENEEVIAIYDNIRDAALDAQLFGIDYIKVPSKANLLSDLHGVSYVPDTDDFGRPGDSYNWVVGTTPVKMFYADAPVATFEGPVAEKALFAAAGIKTATATYFSYELIEDGYETGWNFKACKATKSFTPEGGSKTNDGEWTAAGTGYGIKTELYKEKVGQNYEYTLVAIRDYLGTVSTVTPATATADRSIKVTLAQCSTGYESTKVSLKYETEDFAQNDVVVVNVSYAAGGPKVQAIALAESVSGTVTKIYEGAYTIGGEDYVVSQNHTLTDENTDGIWDELTLSILPGAWYVDSFGNLMAVKTPATVTNEWNYGVVIDHATTRYNAGALLGSDAAVNAEKIMIYTAEGKTVVFDGAFTVNAQNYATFVGSSALEGKLVRYTLADGKVKMIQAVDAETVETPAVTGVTGASLAIGKGDVDLKNDASVMVGANTLFFVIEKGETDKYAVYTGINNLPTAGLTPKTSTTYEYFYANKANNTADNKNAVAVFMEVDTIATSEQSQAKLVWFAGADKYTTLNALGATIHTYTNVYVDGVKSELTFAGDQGEKAVAGRLWSFTTNSATGYATLGTDMGVLSASSATTATIGRIESNYYVSDHSSVKVMYFDENTKFYQVDGTTMAVAEVEALPAVSTTGAYTIEQIMASNGADPEFSVAYPADIIYFAVVPTR